MTQPPEVSKTLAADVAPPTPADKPAARKAGGPPDPGYGYNPDRERISRFSLARTSVRPASQAALNALAAQRAANRLISGAEAEPDEAAPTASCSASDSGAGGLAEGSD